MIQQTEVTIYGCRVWLEGQDKRAVKSATLRLSRFFKAQAEIMKEVLVEEGKDASQTNRSS